jgi:cysteine synthase
MADHPTQLTWDLIADARTRIAGKVNLTPVLTSSSLDAQSGARLYFKCENFQKCGAFKARGATNAVFALMAFRYDTTTVAIILGDTATKEATLAVEKLRKIISEVRLPAKNGADKGPPAQFSAGLAEAVVKQEYDPVDIVTEVINRAEHALAQSLVQGPGKVVALSAALAAGAVA